MEHISASEVITEAISKGSVSLTGKVTFSSVFEKRDIFQREV